MKKPTIKDTNRAYVRLYKYVVQHRDWEEFKTSYKVQIIEYGLRKNGDCGAHVLDANGELATLGSTIPNKITYSYFVEPPIETWSEYYKEGNVTRCVTDSR